MPSPQLKLVISAWKRQNDCSEDTLRYNVMNIFIVPQPKADFVWTELKKLYSSPTHELLAWDKFGSDVRGFFNITGFISFLQNPKAWVIYRNGNLYVPPEKNTPEKEDEQLAKKKTVKRTKSDPSEQKTPVEVKDDKEKNEVSARKVSDGQLRKVTAEVTKRIKTTLHETGKDEVDMISTLNDSKTFSKVLFLAWFQAQTVENYFAASFLIANGRLGIDEPTKGPLTLRLTRPSDEMSPTDSVNQGILSLNPERMYKFLKKTKIGEKLDRSWCKQQHMFVGYALVVWDCVLCI